MRVLLWFILSVCLVLLAAWPVPALLAGPGAAGDVVVLVIDDFAYKPHGASVERVAKMWDPAGCAVHPIYAMNTLDGYLAGVREAVEYVERHPRRRCVVNISLGHRGLLVAEHRLFERLAAAGAVVVASAGNESTEVPYYPAAYEDVVCVAAADGAFKADYSNYGPHVDVAVEPQTLTYVKVRHRWTPDGLIVHEIVETESGTSLAAPKLAGLLATLWACRPERTAAELAASVDDYCAGMKDVHYRRGQLGAGLLDERKVLLPVPRFAARYALTVSAAVILGLAACFLAAAALVLGPRLMGRMLLMLALSAVAVVALTAKLPWVVTWGWLVDAALLAAGAGVLASSAARWPWPLGGVRVHLLERDAAPGEARRLAGRLRRLGADMRTGAPQTLSPCVTWVEDAPEGRVCRLAVREGLRYRLESLPAHGRGWRRRVAERIRRAAREAR